MEPVGCDHCADLFLHSGNSHCDPEDRPNTLSTMDGLYRFLVCVAFIGSCKAALAGNFLGSHGCGRYPAPSDIAGTYVHTGQNGDFIRLEIQKEGTAKLDHYVFPVMGTLGGIIRMAGQCYENDWPWEEFALRLAEVQALRCCFMGNRETPHSSASIL